MSKTGRKNKKYSGEFKECVILDMHEHYLTRRETVRKYWGTKNRAEEDSYVATLRKWERIYLAEGVKGLMKERRGRRRKIEEEIPPEPDNRTREELADENRRLRMELEYLKKLSALVLAEERKSGKKRK